jgi:hypothetical protein
MRTTFQTLATWALALTVFAFAFPKLLEVPVSVVLFDKINLFIGLPYHSRTLEYIVGVQELLIGLLLVVALLMKQKGYKLWLLGLLGVVGTMAGALFVEFVIRPGEDIPLTILALGLMGLTCFMLWQHRNGVLSLVGKGSPRANA